MSGHQSSTSYVNNGSNSGSHLTNIDDRLVNIMAINTRLFTIFDMEKQCFYI
jgi:hypothetical protein